MSRQVARVQSMPWPTWEGTRIGSPFAKVASSRTTGVEVCDSWLRPKAEESTSCTWRAQSSCEGFWNTSCLEAFTRFGRGASFPVAKHRPSRRLRSYKPNRPCQGTNSLLPARPVGTPRNSPWCAAAARTHTSTHPESSCSRRCQCGMLSTTRTPDQAELFPFY